jgi:hypothetical protein
MGIIISITQLATLVFIGDSPLIAAGTEPMRELFAMGYLLSERTASKNCSLWSITGAGRKILRERYSEAALTRPLGRLTL